MQEALLALTAYWADRGALITPAAGTEVGAGTLNPATVLRVLGPEPWRVAYVEPSVRPDDARYGENPNRLQTHTQFQVVLKPEPGDPQELYLGSLRALGIDLDAHDVRFVEDDWASPAVGARGLGWEVWLDGVEITQFTYFQQAGGMPLDPISVEITYGIERIMMALQNVDHFKDITYATGVSYGEVFGQAEYEMSRYYLDDADVSTTKRLFEDFASEAQRMLDARLPLPAHQMVLKCSHAFNVLDARGAVSTTERSRAFGRMRGLSRDVARLWVERRAELGHPLGTPPPEAPPAEVDTDIVIDAPADLLFEIGTEELPASYVARAPRSVRDALAHRLAETRLVHGDIVVRATPRRIVATIAGVEPREPDTETIVRGPRVQQAYDEHGTPTKALQGFLRGHQAEPADLKRMDVSGVEYTCLHKTQRGRGAATVLCAALADVVRGLRTDDNMRWSDPRLVFARPIRWLVAVLGEVHLPVVASALASGEITRVHRTADPATVRVTSSSGYPQFLARHGIILDADERRAMLVEAVRGIAAEVGGRFDEQRESRLLDEITNLVEYPTVVRGAIAERHLELPEEILTMVMRKHQRFIPLYDGDDRLLPVFVGVANGTCDTDAVRAGYESVLRARYEDALFFFHTDLRVAPAVLKAGLATLAFEERLGSMAERSHRIAGIAAALADLDVIQLDPQQRQTLGGAAALAKFDLASKMVVELTGLAGTMARHYALHAGESADVADALFDMELPRSAGGETPHTEPGAVLALADRFDLLVSLWAVGANPTGSSDPLGLRRAATGILRIIRSRPQWVDLRLSVVCEFAAEQLRRQGVQVPPQCAAAAQEFIVGRFEHMLHEEGVDRAVVGAVLRLSDTPAHAEQAAAELTGLLDRPDFRELVAALLRIRRILPAGTSGKVDTTAMTEPAEQALAAAFERVRRDDQAPEGITDFADRAVMLTAPINAFFDEVLVLAEDPEQRTARLGLLAAIRDDAVPFLDWEALGTVTQRR